MRISPPHCQPSLTTIPITKSRAFRACNYRETSHRFFWHYHPEVELTWISHGSGWRHVGNSVEPFEPGDLVLLGGLLPHTWVSGPAQAEPAECSVIQFLPELWGAAFWELPEIRPLRAVCDQAVRGLRFCGPAANQVGAMMFRLAATYTADFKSFARLTEILDRLLDIPATPLNASTEGVVAKPNPRLQQLLEWIEGRVTESLTQEEVALQMRMTPPSFSRWFKCHMGCTFQDYVNELRVAHACALLADSNATITETAFRSGFGSLANFNRRFMGITGRTPTEFRSQLMSGALPDPATLDATRSRHHQIHR